MRFSATSPSSKDLKPAELEGFRKTNARGQDLWEPRPACGALPGTGGESLNGAELGGGRGAPTPGQNDEQLSKEDHERRFIFVFSLRLFSPHR